LPLVESLKQQLEAVMGVLLSVPDPALQETLRSLSGDALVRRVLDQVSAGAYGPTAIQELAKSPPDSEAEPTSSGLANAWQLQALRAYSAYSAREINPQPTESPFLYDNSQIAPGSENSPGSLVATKPHASASESSDFGLPPLFSADVELQTAEDTAWANSSRIH